MVCERALGVCVGELWKGVVMRFAEALWLLDVGAKVRRSSWLPGDYVRWLAEMGVFCLGSCLGTERVWQGLCGDLIADDWEVFG
jgi:hypothetical protein